MTKSALVVEGGAMRGIFASGVLDIFMKNEFMPYDFAIGVSAGASNLLGYLSNAPQRSFMSLLNWLPINVFLIFLDLQKVGI